MEGDATGRKRKRQQDKNVRQDRAPVRRGREGFASSSGSRLNVGQTDRGEADTAREHEETVPSTESLAQSKTTEAQQSTSGHPRWSDVAPVFAIDSAQGKAQRYAELLRRESIDFFRHLRHTTDQLFDGALQEDGSDVDEDQDQDQPDYVQIEEDEEEVAATAEEDEVEQSDEEEAIQNEAPLEGSMESWEAQWSQSEIRLFFRGLVRHSRWRADVIAADFLRGTKSEAQVQQLLQLLRRQATRRMVAKHRPHADGRHMMRAMGTGGLNEAARKRQRAVRAAAAVEMSDEWITFEEAQAQTLARWQDEPRQGAEEAEIVSWDRQVLNATLFLRCHSVVGDVSDQVGVHGCILKLPQGSATATYCSLSELTGRLKRVQGLSHRGPSYRRFSEEYAVPAISRKRSNESVALRVIHRAVELGLLAWVHIQGDSATPSAIITQVDDGREGLVSTRWEKDLPFPPNAHLIWVDSIKSTNTVLEPWLPPDAIESARTSLQQSRVHLARIQSQSLTISELSALEQAIVFKHSHRSQTSLAPFPPQNSASETFYRGFDLSNIPREQWKSVKGKIRARLSRGAADMPIDVNVSAGRKRRRRSSPSDGAVGDVGEKRRRLDHTPSDETACASVWRTDEESEEVHSVPSLSLDGIKTKKAFKDFQRFTWIGLKPEDVVPIILADGGGDDERERGSLKKISVLSFAGLATLMRACTSEEIDLEASTNKEDERPTSSPTTKEQGVSRPFARRISKETILHLVNELRVFVEEVLVVLIEQQRDDAIISTEAVQRSADEVLRRFGADTNHNNGPGDGAQEMAWNKAYREVEEARSFVEVEEDEEEGEGEDDEDEQTRLLEGLAPLQPSATSSVIQRAFEWSADGSSHAYDRPLRSGRASSTRGRTAALAREAISDEVDNRKLERRDLAVERRMWSLFGLLPTKNPSP